MLLLILACNDATLGKRNDPPGVAMVAPTPGDLLVEGIPITFIAEVEDETPNAELSAFWRSDPGGSLATPTEVSETTLSLTTLLPAGEITVELEVLDPDRASASDSVALTILPNTPPVATFLSPTDGAIIADNQGIAVSVQLTDSTENDLSALSLNWTGLTGPEHPDATGAVQLSLNPLPVGDQRLAINVTDRAGATATASVLFSVVPADADADGFNDSRWGGTDCDDSNPLIYPLAPEYCNGLDDDCDTQIDNDATDAFLIYPDHDGDSFGDGQQPSQGCSLGGGFSLNGSDCDDQNAATFPGAAEYCDGIDNDCNGLIDDPQSLDAILWYYDADSDGYGDPASARQDCNPAAQEVADNTDCNDANLQIHPNASEFCNGIDDNCDTLIDDASALDASAWYSDRDQDNYGDPNTQSYACTLPAGMLAQSGDCDDHDPAIYPGAFEHCDTVDEDCDGIIDESAIDAVEWHYDGDQDGYGDPVLLQSGCTSPNGYVGNGADCDDSDVLISPQATEICNDSLDNDCDGTANACHLSGIYGGAQADAKLIGSTDENAGSSVAIIDDFDGNGHAEVLVGAWRSSNASSLAGAAFLMEAPTGTTPLSGAQLILTGDDTGDRAGWQVASAGDLDGDLLGDILVAAQYDDDGASNAGAVYLLYGSTTLSGNLSLNQADAKLLGTEISSGAGSAMTVADYDGDGHGDVIIGAKDQNDGGTQSGAVFVMPGPFYGTHSLSTAYARFAGVDSYDFVGTSLGSGDIDGDGLAEILVGAPGILTTDPGWAYLIPGDSPSGSLSTQAIEIAGETDNDKAGSAVAILGDTTGDGTADLAIAAYGQDPGGLVSAGAVYIFLTPPTSALTLRNADLKLTGAASSDRFGTALCAPGDMDGDGLADLSVGANGANSAGGSIYVFYAPLSPNSATAAGARMDGDSAADAIGEAIGAGALSNDGTSDLVYGGTGDATGGTDAGAAWIFYSAGL